jgi:hypothetical protein
MVRYLPSGDWSVFCKTRRIDELTSPTQYQHPLALPRLALLAGRNAVPRAAWVALSHAHGHTCSRSSTPGTCDSGTCAGTQAQPAAGMSTTEWQRAL